MCGGGGGGGGGVSNNNRSTPISRPPPLSIERPPSLSTPERPKLELNQEDTFQGPRSAKKVAKPKERSIIDRAVDEVKQALPKIGDFIRDKIGREPVAQQPPVNAQPAPVIPR